MARPVGIAELETVADSVRQLAEAIDGAADNYVREFDAVQAEQRQLREDLAALSNRIEALARVVSARTDHLV